MYLILHILFYPFFDFILLLNKLTKRSAHADKIIKILSIIIFSYKVLSYTVKNLSGNIFIPVEISAITYFLVPIIIIFKIDKIYNIGSFFGMIAWNRFLHVLYITWIYCSKFNIISGTTYGACMSLIFIFKRMPLIQKL